MDAELLLKPSIGEVGFPLWVERVGVLPDFDMAPDFGFARVHQARPNRLTVRRLLPRLGRKRPSSVALGGEVVLLDPVA
jgi:hypothetical protein